MKKLFLIILFVLFINQSYSYNVSAFSNVLYSWTKNNLSKYNIVKTFCDNVNNFNDWEFNSKESLFLNILCLKIWIDTEYQFKDEENLKFTENKKKLIYEQCKITWWYTTDSSSLNNINFSCVSSNIFNELANDYINIATYFAYWWFKQDEWLKKFEQDFYLWEGICDDSYLKSDDDNKDYCIHKKTYKYFKELILWLNNWIKDLYFIDVNADNIYDKMSWKQSKNLLNIKDKLYNELYFYSLFLEYYISILKTKPNEISLKSDNYMWIKQVQQINQEEIKQWKKNILIACYTIKKSFSVLKDIYWVLPLHIWYMALKEDIVELMKAWSRIYTPIDQLRTKLKNVQDKDKK